MKFSALLVGALAAIGFSAASSYAADTVALTLSVDQSSNTWQVFAAISSDTSDTSGLAGVQIGFTYTGNVTITPDGTPTPGSGDDDNTSLDLPQGQIPFPTNKEYQFGFDNAGVQATGTNGIGIDNAQSTTYSDKVISGVTYFNIITGVGLAAGTFQGVTYANPVLVADGTYTGNLGTLSVFGQTTTTTLLPQTMPTATTGGANVQTFSPDFVTGQTAIIGSAVPEPASLSLLALGGLALIARRRKIKA